MNILVIDYCCNSVDFSWRLSQEQQGIRQVYLMSDWVCPEVWKSEHLSFIAETQVHAEILQQVKKLDIHLVVNFNSLLGAAGLLEYLKDNAVEAIGANKAFADTEINKLEFKRWLLRNDFLTPAIQFEGLLAGVIKQSSRFSYPVVIKPDIQAGPQIAVLRDVAALMAYVDTVRIDFPQAEYGIVFVIEDEIPSEEVVQVHYVIASGKPYITHSIKALFGPKLPSNKLGALVAISPWQKLQHYQAELIRLLNVLAKTGAATIGTLQCMLGNDGQLYIIENNARPAACNMYDDWFSLSGFINALSTRNTSQLEENCLYMNKPRQYTVGMPLIHQQANIDFTDLEFQLLKSTGIHMYAFSKDNSYCSSSAKMPSLLIVGGDTPEQAVDIFNQNFSAISKFVPYNSLEMHASIFDG